MKLAEKIKNYEKIISDQQTKITYLTEKLDIEKEKFSNYLKQEELKQQMEKLKIEREKLFNNYNSDKPISIAKNNNNFSLQFVQANTNAGLNITSYKSIQNPKSDGEYRISFLNKFLDSDIQFRISIHCTTDKGDSWIAVGCGNLDYQREKKFVFVSHQHKLYMISFFAYNNTSANNYSWNDGNAHALPWNKYAFSSGEVVTVSYNHTDRSIKFDTSQGTETITGIEGENYPIVILGRINDRVEILD